MRKEFLSYDIVRNNALRMAHRIHKDGFCPDIIYVSLRGGAYIGNVISEYFKVLTERDRPILYAAVVARSYLGVKERKEIRIDGWTYSPEYLRQGDRILLVDDIFDSGCTLNYLAEVIIRRGIPREDLKVAVHDFKVFPQDSHRLPITPDYYCRRHEINSPDDDVWIHYLSHELVGLTPEERSEHFLSREPDLQTAFGIFEKDRGNSKNR